MFVEQSLVKQIDLGFDICPFLTLYNVLPLDIKKLMKWFEKLLMKMEENTRVSGKNSTFYCTL